MIYPGKAALAEAKGHARQRLVADAQGMPPPGSNGVRRRRLPRARSGGAKTGNVLQKTSNHAFQAVPFLITPCESTLKFKNKLERHR